MGKLVQHTSWYIRTGKMVKPSIVLLLILGAIFVQLIPAHASDSNSETEDPDLESSDGDDSGENESGNETDEESPALTCLLFADLGCNTECSLVSDAFSINGTGKCTDKNICQCDLHQDHSFEGLFRTKFNAEDTLKKIKRQDKNTVAAVSDVLRVPFQTVTQTITRLRKVLRPEIADSLVSEDSTPAWNSNLVESHDILNHDAIKKYVSEKLKPILESSSDQLKKSDYKSALQKSLKENTDEDLESIINEVRRTKNENLNDIVNAYLESANIKEAKNTDEDDIADAFSHQIIDLFVNYIERQKKPDEKKIPSRKSSNKTGKSNGIADKKPPKQKNPKTNEKSFHEEESNASSEARFQLPSIDKDFTDMMHATFQTKKFKLNYHKNSEGGIHFTWKKANDLVEMNISSSGSINQVWRLGDVKIELERNSNGGAIRQVWDFGKTKYTCSKYFPGGWSRRWMEQKKDLRALKEYQNLIKEWCAENDFLLQDKKQCIIY